MLERITITRKERIRFKPSSAKYNLKFVDRDASGRPIFEGKPEDVRRLKQDIEAAKEAGEFESVSAPEAYVPPTRTPEPPPTFPGSEGGGGALDDDSEHSNGVANLERITLTRGERTRFKPSSLKYNLRFVDRDSNGRPIFEGRPEDVRRLKQDIAAAKESTSAEGTTTAEPTDQSATAAEEPSTIEERPETLADDVDTMFDRTDGQDE